MYIVDFIAFNNVLSLTQICLKLLEKYNKPDGWCFFPFYSKLSKRPTHNHAEKNETE